jgi:hypothetical protein
MTAYDVWLIVLYAGIALVGVSGGTLLIVLSDAIADKILANRSVPTLNRRRKRSLLLAGAGMAVGFVMAAAGFLNVFPNVFS